MKLRFYYIIISLLLSNSLFANITESEYNALIDYVNCEYGRFLLEDNKNQQHLAGYNAAMMDSCDFVKVIEFYRTDERFLKKNGAIAYYIEDIKKQYKSDNLKSLYTNTIKFFNDPMIDTIIRPHIKTLSNNADYLSFKENLTNEIKSVLEIKPETKTALDDETTEETGNSIFDILTYPYILGFLLIAFVIWFGMILWKIYQKYQNDTTTHTMPKRKPIAQEIQPIKRVKPVPIKVEEAKPKPKTIKPIIDRAIIEEPKTPKTHTIPQFIRDLKDENKLTFYMPPPSVSGSFYSFDKMDKFKQDEAMFRFEIVSEKYQICQFFVVNDPNVATQGMMDFEKFLHPACVSENEPFPSASQIITVKPGVVKRSAKHWRVQQKALIKFV